MITQDIAGELKRMKVKFNKKNAELDELFEGEDLITNTQISVITGEMIFLLSRMKNIVSII